MKITKTINENYELILQITLDKYPERMFIEFDNATEKNNMTCIEQGKMNVCSCDNCEVVLDNDNMKCNPDNGTGFKVCVYDIHKIPPKNYLSKDGRWLVSGEILR